MIKHTFFHEKENEHVPEMNVTRDNKSRFGS